MDNGQGDGTTMAAFADEEEEVMNHMHALQRSRLYQQIIIELIFPVPVFG